MGKQVPVPPGAPWHRGLIEFAWTYDAYTLGGGVPAVGARANALIDAWKHGTPLPDDLVALREAPHFEERRWHHYGNEEPTGRDREYIDALIEKIREVSGGTVEEMP